MGTDFMIATLTVAFSIFLAAWGGHKALLLKDFPSLEPPKHNGMKPKVSIIIPVRNQELTIGACLKSVIEQDYPVTEIIVVDGQSTDRTVEIVRSFGTRITLLSESPLPSGWVGKNWACHMGYLCSSGQYLLFTDGDVIFTKDAISASLYEAMQSRSHMLTLWPKMLMQSFWEKTVLTFIFISFFVEFGGRQVNDPDDKRWAAFGPFILVDRNSYTLAGGHEAIHSSTGEDYRLAQRFKESQLKVRVLEGTRFVSTRMYSNLREIWHGFLKNEFESFDYKLPPAFLATAKQAAVHLLPFCILVAGALALSLGHWLVGLSTFLPFATVTIAMVVLYRLMDYEARYAVLSAVGAVIYLGIRVHSIYLGITRRGVDWKGRTYGR